MATTWINRTILKRYFSGMTDLECELIEQDSERSNQYRHENTVFVQEIKPFTEFYNVVAPTGYIMALNKELNALVSKIERPKQRLYA
ncbi:hypothetical protein FGL74_04005 [Leuconostoc koreense]|nr:hypothetical protein FGL74_04005 [Leuconostoc mesenteroides]QGM24823.1 hypothetical protein GJV51_01985 [Leuconostoc mesenteroides subsp. mesenteroides]